VARKKEADRKAARAGAAEEITLSIDGKHVRTKPTRGGRYAWAVTVE